MCAKDISEIIAKRTVALILNNKYKCCGLCNTWPQKRILVYHIYFRKKKHDRNSKYLYSMADGFFFNIKFWQTIALEKMNHKHKFVIKK